MVLALVRTVVTGEVVREVGRDQIHEASEFAVITAGDDRVVMTNAEDLRSASGQMPEVYPTVQLNGQLAAGKYLVNVTAGTMTFTERLIVQP